MSTRTLTMPRLGETMEEGVIVGWLVQLGSAFERGQPILELETDKTVVEYPALGAGVLDEVLVGEGDRVPVGAPIARVSGAEGWGDEGSDGVPVEPEPEAGVAVLTMPRLGETMDEGVIVQWLVAEGGSYKRGEAILELETDKTVAEVPALSDGRLLRILAQPGERLAVGSPIAEVEGEVEAPTAAPKAIPVAAPVAAPAPQPTVARASGALLRATPAARKLARHTGVSLEAMTGSGRRGRIEARDVEGATQGAAPADLAYLETPLGRIAYAATGTGGTTFLLLHGFAGDRTAWAVTAAAIARAGHRSIAPDLPSHGATEIEASDLSGLAEALTAFAEKLPAPLVIVGHSLGAALAVALAGRIKAERLVLLTPAGAGPQIGAAFVHGMAGASTPGEVSHLLRLLGPKGGALSDTALSAMASEAAKGRLHGLASALATPDGRQRLDILRPLAALPETLPVRAIFGTDDQIVPATDALNLPPRVAVHFLASGHMPQWDAPRDVASLILKGERDG